MGTYLRIGLRLLGWLLLGLPALWGCQDDGAQGRPRVVCTIFPLYEFARAVAGERAEVTLLLPPGMDPHGWEPRARDLAAVSRADLFVYVHESLEPWARGVLEAAGGKGLEVVAAAEGLGLGAGQDKGSSMPAASSRLLDPHVWLDLFHDQKIVARIARALSSLDQEHRDRYEANARAYSGRLAALDRAYETGLARCRHRTIILGGHSAFAYLARRYGLIQVPLYGVSADAQPTPQQLARVIEAARKAGVRYVFFDPMVHPRLARVIAEEIGARVLPLNTGVSLRREQIAGGATFLSIMEENLETLKKGLECGEG